ncbi:unnamed protein product [Hermetia illucens]|uniref:Uncharacterized protein n=1 Tax=Hermetia illucens TaxID=343691 RepID=A0A7R8UHL5_HERIL|nr:unnamed protein product [Hermetia illucens]
MESSGDNRNETERIQENPKSVDVENPNNDKDLQILHVPGCVANNRRFHCIAECRLSSLRKVLDVNRMPAPSRPRGFAGGSGGGAGRPAPNTPMSERQQMALLMQMTSSSTSPSSSSNAEMSPGSSHGPARSRDRNERGETTLHFAAIKGDQETVKKLLESGISPDVTDFAGWTPLHEACNHAHYNVALALVKAGANVNAKGLDDDTPLHDAAVSGHLKLVKMLVEKGADVHAKNRKGKTPADVAAASVVSYLTSVRECIVYRFVEKNPNM